MTLRRALSALAIAILLVPAAGAEPASDGSDAALSGALGAIRQATPGSGGGLDPRLGALEDSPELGQEFSDLATAIFTDLLAQCDGDPAKMADMVAKGRSDPEAFVRSLQPATRAKLEKLSRKLESKSPNGS